MLARNPRLAIAGLIAAAAIAVPTAALGLSAAEKCVYRWFLLSK